MMIYEIITILVRIIIIALSESKFLVMITTTTTRKRRAMLKIIIENDEKDVLSITLSLLSTASVTVQSPSVGQ